MPIYMDMHQDLGDVTEEDLRKAHDRDLEVQGKHGVRFLTYWFNSPDGKSFCLVDAPDREAAVACHKESHGLVPHEVMEVDKPTVGMFMGEWERNAPNEARLDGPGSPIDTGLRAIMFTDLEGSTDVSSRLGDDRAVEMVRLHDVLVRGALTRNGGREVKHTGDGILASFTRVSAAVECAIEIQRRFRERMETSDLPVKVRVGISAGEPVDHSNDLFGAAVNLAARICAHAEPGKILVSSSVKELSIGKPLRFISRGLTALKGFDDPVLLYEVPSDLE